MACNIAYQARANNARSAANGLTIYYLN